MRARELIASVLLLGSTAFAQDHDPRADRVVLRLDGMDSVEVQADVVFREVDGQKLALDLYLPPKRDAKALLPVVFFVNGVGDPPDMPLKSWGQYTGWGRLCAASGLAAVTHNARREHVREDAISALDWIRAHGKERGLDGENVALWSCSANVGVGLPLAMDSSRKEVKCAVTYYGMAQVDAPRADVPLLLVRAGLDRADQNGFIGNYVEMATRRQLPLTFIHHASGRHAFDVLDDDDASREVVRATLAFLRSNLSKPVQALAALSSERAEARRLHGAQKWDEATQLLAHVLAASPSDGNSHYLLGECRYGAKDYAAAEASWKRAAELRANPAEAQYNIACCRSLQGDKDGAIAWLTRAKESGMRNLAQVANDPDLAGVRDDPRVAALLRE